MVGSMEIRVGLDDGRHTSFFQSWVLDCESVGAQVRQQPHRRADRASAGWPGIRDCLSHKIPPTQKHATATVFYPWQRVHTLVPSRW